MPKIIKSLNLNGDLITFTDTQYDISQAGHIGPCDLLIRDVSTSDNRQSPQNIELSKLNIIYLNVCGLKSKLKLLHFEEFMQKYKLIFLTETKLDELDDEHYRS